MHDSDLDALLRESAPRRADPVSLDACIDRILAEQRTRRTRRRATAIGVASVFALTLGGGTAVAASNGLETPWGWIADNVFVTQGDDDEQCFAGFQVIPEGTPALPYSGDREEVMEVAKQIVAEVDLDAIDTSAEEAELRDRYARATDEHGNPSPLEVSETDLRTSAKHEYLSDLLFSELEDRGYADASDGHLPVGLSARWEDCS